MTRYSAAQQLRNIEDAIIEDILRMPYEELRAEMIEDGLDPDAVIDRVRQVIQAVIAKSKVTP